MGKTSISQEFQWGTVREMHEVGMYVIVEYEKETTGEVAFHPYIDGVDTNHAYGSLDAALAGAIAIRHEGLNTRADTYFMRAIQAVKG